MKKFSPDNYIPPPPEKKISKAVSQEEEPKIRFKFYYTGHTYEKDFEKLEEVFPKADIYVPENAGWDEYWFRVYNAVSQGIVSPNKVVEDSKDDSFLKEISIIYNTKKPIFFLDITGDFYSENDRKEEEFGNKVLEAEKFFLSGRFDEAVSLARECARGFAILSKEREDFIKTGIVEAMPKMIKQYPNLADKLKSGSPLTVLLSLGAMHTKLYHKLKQEGVDVEREFSSDLPLIFDHWHELERSYIFDKEPRDELVARGLLELLLSKSINKFCKSSEEYSMALRKLISQLSFDKIKSLSMQAGAMAMQTGVLGKNFVSILAQEGVKVPQTRQEFEDLLKY